MSTVAAVSDVSSLREKARDDWIHSFEVPWEKFPPALLEACEKKVEPKGSHRSEMVRIIVEEVCKYTEKPGKKNLEKIAFDVVKKYPESFRDQIDGMAVGVGHSSLTQQLVHRVENSRRSVKRFLVQSPKASAKRKCDAISNYGCVEWSPPLPQKEKVSIAETKDYLINEYQKTSPCIDKVEVYMKETYPFQRDMINNKASVREVKENWPFLFDQKFMMNHFKLLTGKFVDLSFDDLEKRCSTVWK